MKLGRLMIAVNASFALLLSGFARASEPPRIVKNPFARPPSEVTVNERTPTPRSGDARVSMDLRATLVAKSDRLANVAGKILRPGDDIDGYKLVRVYEDRAVFEQEGKQVTIYVKPDVDENDD